jgi:hypothetical protein
LDQRLRYGGQKRRAQALVGRGGVGKTQIALRYAQKHQADYDVRWGIPAEERAVLEEQYAALAKMHPKLGLPCGGDLTARITAVRNWFGQNDRWLLVFDNARDPAAVDRYLPRGGGGHVLITSRNLNWGAPAGKIEVNGFSAEEAIEFLRKRTGRNQDPAAGELAQELDYLPLALEHAAAYMEQAVLTSAQYLERYRSQRGMLPEPLWDALRLSLMQLWADMPAAVDLFYLCAFLAPDGIPRDLLAKGVEGFSAALAGAAEEPFWLDGVVACLRRYSLVQAQPDVLAIHRLNQELARQHLPSKARLWWLQAATQLLLGAYPIDGAGAQD